MTISHEQRVWEDLTDAQRTVMEISRPLTEVGRRGSFFTTGRLRTARSMVGMVAGSRGVLRETSPRRFARTSWGEQVYQGARERGDI